MYVTKKNIKNKRSCIYPKMNDNILKSEAQQIRLSDKQT